MGVHRTKGKLLVQSLELGGVLKRTERTSSTHSRQIFSRSQTLNNTASPHQVTDKRCVTIRENGTIHFKKGFEEAEINQ